jgi:hypothetical protein
VTPVARATQAKPKGPKERRLLRAVDEAYPSTVAFLREVSNVTKDSLDAEKTAFYRIVRGEIGDKTGWRLRKYAVLLKVKPEEILRPAELRAAAVADSPARRRPNLRSLEADLETLADRVDRLARQVSRLAQQGQRGNQAQGGSS